MKYLSPIVFIALAAAMLATGCKKATNCNGVPNVGVNFSIDLNQPQNNQLTVTGGSEYYSGGNAGLVVYRYQQDQFQAYDCLCPYDGNGNSSAVILVEKGNKIQAQCQVCKSVFNLSDGSVSSGPSSCPLKAYKTNYDGVQFVYVTN